MPRIPPRDDDELAPLTGPGTVSMSMLFSVMAQRPDIAMQSRQLLETTMRAGTVELKLKELLAIRVSQVNHCHY
ncbi:MAG: carboxymuconolactone decarboxylase family protein [Ktedonobacteraceae bacterium]